MIPIRIFFKQLFCVHNWKIDHAEEVPDFDDCPDICTTYITEVCKKCGKTKEYILS